MVLKEFQTFGWVPNISISWMNKKENRKVEDFSNHVAKFYFSRSIYIYLKQDTILYHYHFIKRHFNIRGYNSAVLDSPLHGMHLKSKTCSIVLFLILPGTKWKPLQRRVRTALSMASFQFALSPFAIFSWQGCSYLALSGLTPAASRALSLWQSLHSHTGQASSSILSGLYVKGAGGGESPAEAAAVSWEGTKQLLAVMAELSSHLLCTKVALQLSSTLALSLRRGEPHAFHLDATTQGFCHLSHWLSGLSIYIF